MSVSVLTAAVGAGQQLPGGMVDFNETATPANAAWFGSASNTAIPAYGQGNFLMGGTARYGATGTRTLLAHYLNSSNSMSIRMTSASPARFELLLWLSNGNRVNPSVELKTLNCAFRWLAWRVGDTWGIGVLDGQFGTSQPSFLKDEKTLVTGSLYDNHNSIASNAASRYYLGSSNGSTTVSTAKWIGAIGLTFEIPLGSETLADHNLSTDAEKKALLYDFQRLFSACGFVAGDIQAWGNWTNSSGVAKTCIAPTAFAAGDRLVCPFTGKYLSLGAGAANAVEVMHPPYTEPSHTEPVQIWRASGNDLDLPSCFESPSGEGLVSYRTQKDQSSHPSFFLDFVKFGGGLNRWAVPVDVPYTFVDSSAANVQGFSYNGINGVASPIGDTHCAMPVLPIRDTDGSIKSILCMSYFHSNAHSNIPATGDTMLETLTFTIVSDSGQQVVYPLVAPWGTAYSSGAYDHILATYALGIQRALYTSVMTRNKSATAADLTEILLNNSDYTVQSQQVITDDGTLRNYPGAAVNMSDGRTIRFAYGIKGDSTTNICYSAIIMPPVADFATDAAWFAPTGQNLGGSDGIAALGAIDQRTTNALHITTDNDAFFPSLPALSTGMDALYMTHPMYVNGDFEGIAAIVRKSTANGDKTTVTTDSSGAARVPYDACRLRRWTYTTGAAPTLVARDSFDIMPILQTLMPGTWPSDVNFDAAEVAGISTMQFGSNQMILFVHDPKDVAMSVNKGPLNLITGYRLRACIFSNLSAADPTDYVEFGEVILDLATDNSEGYALYPYFAGTGNDGSKSVCVWVSGGVWTSQGYTNRNVHAVDMRTELVTLGTSEDDYQKLSLGGRLSMSLS